MGKVTADAIRTRLMHLIRNSWKELQWKGINVDMIHNIENVAPILIDFQYEGSGDYLFSADISFMVKEQNNPFGMHRERFRIFPHSKMSIIETDIDFNIEVSSQLPLQKL